MKRRGFLGFMGGAVVAGPSMAKQAAQTVGIEAMSLGSIAPDYDLSAGSYGVSGGPANAEYDHGQWLKDRIAEVSGISNEERARRMASIHPSTLDPDLAVNRSMSLQFKVREQKRRILERSMAAEHFSLSRDLAAYVKRGVGNFI